MNYRFDKIAFNSTAKKTPTESDKEHYIGLEHIDSECLEITRWGSNVAPIGEKLIMKKGDVLFGKRRAYQRKLAIAPFDGIFSAHGMVLRPNEEVVDKNYFPFFMSSDLFMERAVQISVGGLSPTINWKDLREQEFPLPSLAEQKVLADKLWAAYRLKESYKKLLATTEEMVKSQFIEMFGTIESTKPLTDFIEVSFPGEWGQEDKNGSGVKVIRTTNFTNNGKLDLSDVVTRDIDSVKVEKKKLSKGDIILERSGGTNENPVGRVVYFEEDGVYLFNNFTQLLRCKEGVNSLFIFYSLFNYYQMNKNVIRSMGNKTTGIQNLKMDRYWLIPIADVSIERQKEFESIYRQADKSGFDGRKSQFIEMTGNPRTNPKGWPVKTLPELATYSIGLTYKPENISEDGTIVLRSGNIQNSKIDLGDIVRVNCPIKESIYVQKNDILMCSRNGSAALVGKVAMIKDIPEPMTYGAFMTVIRSEYSDYLYLYFQSNDFREQVSTGKSSTMNQITQNMLDKISLPLPDDETRKKLSIILHQANKSGSVLLKLSSR